MSPEDQQKDYLKVKKLYVGVGFLIFAALLLGIFIGNSNNKSTPNQQTSTGTMMQNNTHSTKKDLASIATYTVPDALHIVNCPSNNGTVYLSDAAESNCADTPPAPISLSVDPGNHKDCNELQNIQNVKKHTCISLFINGHKTLRSLTEYLASSSYKQDTTIYSYYFDSGNGVISASYQYTGDNPLQNDFEKLAMSLQSK